MCPACLRLKQLCVWVGMVVRFVCVIRGPCVPCVTSAAPESFFCEKRNMGPGGEGWGPTFPFGGTSNNQVAYKLVLQFEDLC